MPSDDDTYAGFCTECRFPIKSFEDIVKCPNCNTTATPCSYEHQVNVSVNWQELRVLCMYAEFHARRVGRPGLVYGIVGEILDQYPEFADAFPLTFAGEIAALKKEYPDVTVIDTDGKIDRSFE